MVIEEMTEHELLRHFCSRQTADAPSPAGSKEALVDESNLPEFIATAAAVIRQTELEDILYRAISFSLPAEGAGLESSFITLYSALESALTFFRRQDDYEIIPSENFRQLERDLRKWLKQHPLLIDKSDSRALIYEKIRELNRFPFSHVFQNFCARYSLDLSDLWPLTGSPAEWPLMEIRHRLVHGDPFASRPSEAMLCAREHLRWTVERMLLSLLGWPVARSNVCPERLLEFGGYYQNWQAERARFS
ncbi:MAG TPA: hypothetical protein VF717_05735 [Pyrinomonadaceae bacterium]|jgi:hypothetical protein